MSILFVNLAARLAIVRMLFQTHERLRTLFAIDLLGLRHYYRALQWLQKALQGRRDGRASNSRGKIPCSLITFDGILLIC
jgi:hypothetical protein